MKTLLALLLLTTGVGGGGYYYLQSGGEVPAGAQKYLAYFISDSNREDISKRSSLYKFCHANYASRISSDSADPSRAACDCFETRINYISPSIKQSVMERMKTDYETANGSLMGAGRVPTTKAAWDFLASCQIAAGDQKPVVTSPVVTRPVGADEPGKAQPVPVDDDALKSMLRDL